MPDETAQRPTIGQVQGLTKVPGITQYLGIQYATLKDRFSRGELVDSYAQDRILDATNLGYDSPCFPVSAVLSQTNL